MAGQTDLDHLYKKALVSKIRFNLSLNGSLRANVSHVSSGPISHLLTITPFSLLEEFVCIRVSKYGREAKEADRELSGHKGFSAFLGV